MLHLSWVDRLLLLLGPQCGEPQVDVGISASLGDPHRVCRSALDGERCGQGWQLPTPQVASQLAEFKPYLEGSLFSFDDTTLAKLMVLWLPA